MLHLARPIVRGVTLGIAVGRQGRRARIERTKLLNKDWILGRTIEEDNEHHGCEADCERDFVLVHGSWRKPVKNTLACKEAQHDVTY